MTDEYVEETDTLDNPPEDIEETTFEDESLEEDTSTNEDEEEDEFSGLSEDELREKARKIKKTANNYKREIETKGLRKKELDKPVKGESTAFKTDYLSKRADILDDFDSEFKELDDSDFNKLKTLLNPALEGIYAQASKDKRFVARGELKRTVKDLVNFAKSKKDHQEDVEKARLDGISERDKMDDGEIKGKSKSKPAEGTSNEVKKLAKEKGWTVEETKIILDNRKRLEKEYKPKY